MLIEQLRKSEIKISKLHKLPHAFAHVQVLRNSENEISDLFYLSVNDDYAQYFGFHSKSHIENKRYTEIFQLKELKKHWIQHFDQVINSGSKESFLEYSKESERWFDIHCLSPANEELIVLFQDVTEYKSHEAKINKLNEKLQTSNRELEAFSYSVSHDLRAPLRAINGFAKALESTTAYSSDKQTHHYINRINENGMRMGQLIDDLLQFSRLSRESIVLKEIDVTSMVKNIVDTYHSKQKKNISIGRLPVVKGDLNLLQQVFINLISNAIKFSSKIKTPQIEVTGIELDDKVTIIISDNGVGFDMAHKDKLFKVFERLHHQDDFKGTGVGLALCKKIIDKIGGEIWAKSDLGKGASFFVQLKK
ncbi:ATP-binding protein [Ekhidna sp.]|uniref:sensor histidine kinase n=1 Tax=Ekhidna sp. TaxID=2608089 RepID=UPI0032983472